jgi:hypothetical protein
VQCAATAFSQYGGASSFGFNIYVDQVTDDGQAQEMAATLKHKGQDALLSALEDMKDRGRVAPTGSVGTGIRVVRVHPANNGGYRIVLVRLNSNKGT